MSGPIFNRSKKPLSMLCIYPLGLGRIIGDHKKKIIKNKNNKLKKIRINNRFSNPKQVSMHEQPLTRSLHLLEAKRKMYIQNMISQNQGWNQDLKLGGKSISKYSFYFLFFYLL